MVYVTEKSTWVFRRNFAESRIQRHADEKERRKNSNGRQKRDQVYDGPQGRKKEAKFY